MENPTHIWDPYDPVVYILLVLVAAPVHPQERLPVIDMHLHALAADAQGPPPVAICTPINPFPVTMESRSFHIV